VFEQAKTVDALDGAATVIGIHCIYKDLLLQNNIIIGTLQITAGKAKSFPLRTHHDGPKRVALKLHGFLNSELD
jgi:hypothetical protein